MEMGAQRRRPGSGSKRRQRISEGAWNRSCGKRSLMAGASPPLGAP